MGNAPHLGDAVWSPALQFLCGRVLGHRDRNHSDGDMHYAYCLRCGYLFGHPWGSGNTEKGSYLGALITAYGNSTFDCGTWTTDEDGPYEPIYDQSQAARRALLAEIARQKLGIGQVPDGRECARVTDRRKA